MSNENLETCRTNVREIREPETDNKKDAHAWRILQAAALIKAVEEDVELIHDADGKIDPGLMFTTAEMKQIVASQSVEDDDS